MSADVRLRKVFYLPGFDPFPARRYRELFRKEGAKQALISGYELALEPSTQANSWTAVLTVNGKSTRTELVVLEWSDIVRASMSHSILATYGLLARTARIYLQSGALFRLLRLRKGPVIAALYPVAILLGALFLAIAVLLTSMWAVGGVIGMALGLMLAGALFWLLRRLDNRTFAFYLMQDYSFAAANNGANSQALEVRLKEFLEAVTRAMSGDADEVLIIGHSSGAQLAVHLAANLVRAGLDTSRLGLLTIGQAIPMVSFLPDAQLLRRDMRDLSIGSIPWVDVSAPGDGCSFALCDPVAVSGVATPLQKWPLVLSAAFSQTLSEASLRDLRWRFFRIHFQYLCAFDQPGWYDYFQITAGPKTLRDRFQGRQNSPSRISKPVSPHTSIAP